MEHTKQPVDLVTEWCGRHGYGHHLDGPDGLACVECLKRAGQLPADYELCSECGWDHAYEPAEAAAAHGERPCA